MDAEEFDFLNIKEAAELLRIPVATLRWWRSTGKGPVSLKFGRHVRYPRRELRRWIETRPSGGLGDG
jgi:excisionase family DNA binding protein